MKRKITVGITSVTLPIYVTDSSSSTGAGLGSLVYNSGSLVAEYRRQGQASWTPITLAAGTLGTWSSGGWIADGSLAGAYELGVPNAAFTSGARWVAIRAYGATNMKPVLIEIELDAVDYQDATAFGLSRLDAAISTRSTYAGGDTSGVTTLVSRLTSTRAGLLDNLVHLDADVSSRLAPTTAGRTLDVSIGGEAGIDWANVGSPTTTVNLSGTTISTSQAVASVTDKAGFSLSSSGVDLVLIETGVNLRQFCSVAGAALAGVVSGAGTGSLVFKSIGGSTTRIAADTDTNGNRTTVALTLPS